MRVVHAKRPEQFHPVRVRELHQHLQRINPFFNEFGHAIVRESAFACREDLSDLCEMSEHSETRTPRAVENGIHLCADQRCRAKAKQLFFGSCFAKIHWFVSIVVENDTPLARFRTGISLRAHCEAEKQTKKDQEKC